MWSRIFFVNFNFFLFVLEMIVGKGIDVEKIVRVVRIIRFVNMELDFKRGMLGMVRGVLLLMCFECEGILLM